MGKEKPAARDPERTARKKDKKPKRTATPLAPTKLRPEEEAPENIEEIELDYGDADDAMDVDHSPQDPADDSEYPTGEDPSMTDLIDPPTAGATYADITAKRDVTPLPQSNARPRNERTVSRPPTAPPSGRAVKEFVNPHIQFSPLDNWPEEPYPYYPPARPPQPLARLHDSEANKKRVHEPQSDLADANKLATDSFGDFINFRNAVCLALTGKIYSAAIEGWIFRQVVPNTTAFNYLQQSLRLQRVDPATGLMFPSVDEALQHIFSVVFRGRTTCDVCEDHLARVKVRQSNKDAGSHILPNTMALAYHVREVCSYYTEAHRPDEEQIMARIKARLPESVKNSIIAAQNVTPGRRLSQDQFLDILRAADDSHQKNMALKAQQEERATSNKNGAMQPRGKPKASGNGGGSNNAAGGNANGAKKRDYAAPDKGRDKKPKLSCNYCKKPGHTISECRTLKAKNKGRGKDNKSIPIADLKVALAEILADKIEAKPNSDK